MKRPHRDESRMLAGYQNDFPFRPMTAWQFIGRALLAAALIWSFLMAFGLIGYWLLPAPQ